MSSSSSDLDLLKEEVADSDDELLDLLTETKKAGACGGGGCCGQPQWDDDDREGMERARRQYRKQAKDEARLNPPLSFWEKVKRMMYFLSLVAACLLLVGLKSGEDEWYNRRNLDYTTVDHYEVLGVSKKEATSGIRRQFRKLASQWHPDRNPNCDACAEKFTAIQEAFEVLSDPTKRSIYDSSHSVNLDTIKPVFTQVLTAENYDALVKIPLTDFTRKAPVWLVMVHSDLEFGSTQFFKIFEALAAQLSGFARFGVVDALRDKKSVKKLPIHVRFHPTVLMLTRGQKPVIMPIGEISGLGSLKQWVHANMPQNYRSLSHTKQFLDFYECGRGASEKPRLLFVRQTEQPPMMFSSSLESWNQVFDIATAPLGTVPKDYRKIVPKGLSKDHALISLPPCDVDGPNARIVRRQLVSRKSWLEFKGMLSQAASDFAVMLTKTSADQLCSSTTVGVRTYCVVYIKPASPVTVDRTLAMHNEKTFEGWNEDEVDAETDFSVYQSVVIQETSELLDAFQQQVLAGASTFILDWEGGRFALLEDDTGDPIDVQAVPSYIAHNQLQFRTFSAVRHRCSSPQAFINALVGDEPWRVRLSQWLQPCGVSPSLDFNADTPVVSFQFLLALSFGIAMGQFLEYVLP
ncbi:MAG: uncharacterized protein KVP18_003595 [Porospora cf. gigantea A]|uniref:uncharacterized protein n=1 Tax=Porospora cf. gigantea A TaxID=2853593 RepID=UPI00355A154C|nr:MAG: hypothetical protein KVP18_003595 [Porospora cf. gigantea A]